MSWLSSKRLAQKVRRNATTATLNAFHGVCSIDKLPTFISKRPFLLIVNTHTHNLPGEHWIAIFIDENKHGELFDSLKLPISNILIRWLNTFTVKWKANVRSFQHLLTATCGAFTLYFILNRLHVKDFETLTTVFSTSPHANERFVDVFYRALK